MLWNLSVYRKTVNVNHYTYETVTQTLGYLSWYIYEELIIYAVSQIDMLERCSGLFIDSEEYQKIDIICRQLLLKHNKQRSVIYEQENFAQFFDRFTFIYFIFQFMPKKGQQKLLASSQKQKLINVMKMLLKIIVDRSADVNRSSSLFDLKFTPNITLDDYFQRIANYLQCSNSIYVIALIFMDRFQASVQNDFCIDCLSIFKVLLTAIVIASKYQDDYYYTNDLYARIGGVPLEELNKMEVQMTLIMNFNFYVTSEEFSGYLKRLQRFYQCHKRQIS